MGELSSIPLSQINAVVKLKYKEEIQFNCKLPVRQSGLLMTRHQVCSGYHF